jgi:hypothetical protein
VRVLEPESAQAWRQVVDKADMTDITAAQAAHQHRWHEAARLSRLTGLPATPYWALEQSAGSRPAHTFDHCGPIEWLHRMLER